MIAEPQHASARRTQCCPLGCCWAAVLIAAACARVLPERCGRCTPLRYAALPGRTPAHDDAAVAIRTRATEDYPPRSGGGWGLLPPEPVKMIICHAAMHTAPNLHPARKSLLLLEPHYTTSVAFSANSQVCQKPCRNLLKLGQRTARHARLGDSSVNRHCAITCEPRSTHAM